MPMRRIFNPIIMVMLLCCLGCQRQSAATDDKPQGSLKVTSAAFKEGELIPVKYTSDGKGISPPLAWSGAPAATVSFALIADDPDAPAGTYVHWVLFNIPASVKKLDEAILAAGTYPNGMVSGHNDRDQFGYTPPSHPMARIAIISRSMYWTSCCNSTPAPLKRRWKRPCTATCWPRGL